MAYSDQDRIEDIFGATAVSKWLDIDNDGNVVTKAARSAKALAVAYEDVNSILRSSHYTIPVADEDGATPEIIAEIEATLAGVWLYEAYGTHDISEDGKGFHRYVFRREAAYETLHEIVAGRRKLNAV